MLAYLSYWWKKSTKRKFCFLCSQLHTYTANFRFFEWFFTAFIKNSWYVDHGANDENHRFFCFFLLFHYFSIQLIFSKCLRCICKAIAWWLFAWNYTATGMLWENLLFVGNTKNKNTNSKTCWVQLEICGVFRLLAKPSWMIGKETRTVTSVRIP